ncbi:MAG: hypothetical protein IPG03_10490 [Candidatus Microthrix sp.]|nr:hypothetical protein [Candidatus Microthrix sp.]MBK6502768.1 hypothetical protein [Candidatus Microthrix sp.]
MPAIAQRIVRATNTITTHGTVGACRWRVQRPVEIEASNVPARPIWTPHDRVGRAGPPAVTAIVLTLALKVPLIGDRFVTLMRPKVSGIIDAEFEAWDGGSPAPTWREPAG